MRRSFSSSAILRAGWGLLDQAVSSLRNLVLGLLVVQQTDVVGVGQFTIAFAVYILALGTSRAIASEPLVVRHSDQSVADWRAGSASACTVTCAFGAAAALLIALLSVPFEGGIESSLLALAIVLPAVLLQDTIRYAAFARGLGKIASLNSLLWLVLLAPAVGIAVTVRGSDVPSLILAWGAAGGVAATIGLLQLKVWSRGRGDLGWLRRNLSLSARFAGEFWTMVASWQIALVVIASVQGATEVGALRAAEILLGPLNIVFMGLSIAAVPEGVRMLRELPQRLGAATASLSLVMVAAAVVWGSFLVALPDRIGREVLAASWPAAEPVLLPYAIAVAGTGALAGPLLALRALGAAKRSFRARIFLGVAVLAASTGGAMLNGAVGAAWGLALANWLGAGVWWYQARQALKEHGLPGRSGAAPQGAEGRALIVNQ